MTAPPAIQTTALRKVCSAPEIRRGPAGIGVVSGALVAIFAGCWYVGLKAFVRRAMA